MCGGRLGTTGLLATISSSSPLSPVLDSLASVGSHREGKVEEEPCSEIAQSHCQQGGTQEAAFWSCRGRPVGVLSTKGTRRERREEQSEEKTTQDTKDGKSPPAKCRRSQLLCAAAENRWLSRNRVQGPSPLLSSSYSLHQIGRASCRERV